MSSSPSQGPTPERTANFESDILSMIGRRLYLDVDTADVCFVFKTGERVPAHKAHLILASDVFRTMFNGSWKEKNEVQIVDTSVAGFKEFLQFFYCTNVTLTMGNVSEVINLAKMYEITGCLNICWTFLKRNMADNNVCGLYDLAIFYEQNELKELCKQHIGSNTAAVFESDGFVGCHRRVLDHILKQGELSCPEAVVFEAAMSWVKSVSNQEELTKEIVQTHLGDLFNEIRFRSMSYDQFVDLLPSYGKLFTGDEFNEILQMIRNAEYQPKIFNALPRTPTTLPWDEGAIIECDRYIRQGNEPYRLQKIDTTSFTTNKPILLGYFMCAPIFIYKNGQYERLQNALPADVTIVRVSNRNECQSEISECTVLHTMKVELMSSFSRKKIKLSKPIIIRPEFKYEIRMNIDISEGCFTRWNLKSEVNLQNGIIVTFHDPLVSGENMGLVDWLGFNRI